MLVSYPDERISLFCCKTDNLFCVGPSLSKTYVLAGPALLVLVITARCSQTSLGGKQKRFIIDKSLKEHSPPRATQGDHAFVGVEHGGLEFWG